MVGGEGRNQPATGKDKAGEDQMGMFDTILREIECPECRQTKEREIKTKGGPCLMDTYRLGDTIEPFFFGVNLPFFGWNDIMGHNG